MSRATIDIETSYKEEYGRKGNPWGDSTYLCSAGFIHTGVYVDDYKVQDRLDEKSGNVYRYGVPKADIKAFPFDLTGVTFLCGHNITFDLLWYWHTPELKAWIKAGGRIWDTAVAEYLLSGQVYSLSQKDPRYGISLDAVAKRRLPKEYHKLDVVKQMWDEGIRTEDIPKEVLLEYQRYDIVATDMIAQQQMKEAQEQGMVQNILDRMDSILATTEMTYNGVYIDRETAEKNRQILVEDIADLEVKLFALLEDYKLPPELNFNWSSNPQKAAYLFGGKIKYEVREQKLDEDTDEPLYCKKKVPEYLYDDQGEKVRYKSGKRAGEYKTRLVDAPDYDRPKMHTVEYFFELPGVVPVEYRKDSWKTDAGAYSVAESVMDDLKALPIDLPEVKMLLDYSGAKKDLSTYYWAEQANGKKRGMLTMVSKDNCIHHHLNHSVTATTRLSSSKPNLQNISTGSEDEDTGEFSGKSRVKEGFKSRFGDDGVMVELDHSQLEVVTKAVLSKCPALAEFILEGKDEHCVWAAFLNDVSYEEMYQKAKVEGLAEWAALRSQAKHVTFSEKYGGGAASISADSGIPVDVIKTAMERRRAAYPRMYEFDDEVFAEVEASRQLSPFQTALGFSAGIGYHRCVTGTLYHFLELDAPKWKQDRDGVFTAFKPTTTKNYPSQGLGGLIIQVGIGRIFRWLSKNDFFDGKVRLVNTVHDCIWLDCHKDYANTAITHCKDVMENTKAYFNTFYKTGWQLEFPVSLEAGPDMLHLKHYHCDPSKGVTCHPPTLY